MYRRVTRSPALLRLAASKSEPTECFASSQAARGLHLRPSPHRLSHSLVSNSTLWTNEVSTSAGSGCRPFSSKVQSRSWWNGAEISPRMEAAESTSFESKPLELPEETPAESEKLLTRRVHILGLGSIGTLIAHSLKCLPNPPPISLLLHRREMWNKFKENGRVIRLVNKKTEVNDEQRGFDADILETDEETRIPFWRHKPDDENAGKEIPEEEFTKTREVYIYTLIVTVKGPATVSALASIKHRINNKTTICLMQNGMGQIDELNRQVFTDPATRPTYMLGIISHGAYLQGMFAVNHAGFGSTSLGIWRDPDRFPLPPKSSQVDVQQLSDEDRKRMYPSDKDLYANLSSRYLLRTLTRSPVLACAAFPYLDIFQLQLEKLAMNAILNPLTGLLNVPNGYLIGQENLTRVQRLLLAEISLVFKSLPELEGTPGVKLRFSSSRLETLVIGVTHKTALNSSSMREDVRKLKKTEIDYINGYIVRRGEELGIKCVLNYMITQLMHAKSSLSSSENSFTPFGTSSIEGTSSVGEDGTVILEDTGSQIQGQTY